MNSKTNSTFNQKYFFASRETSTMRVKRHNISER